MTGLLADPVGHEELPITILQQYDEMSLPFIQLARWETLPHQIVGLQQEWMHLFQDHLAIHQ
jgi:hypothetical protein